MYAIYVINFFVKNGKFIALTQNSLVYKSSVLSTELIEAILPKKGAYRHAGWLGW